MAETPLVDAIVETHDEPMDGSYYAKDGKVWKRPEETARENGTRSISLGFPVCTMSEYTGAEAAETVAAMMNAATHHEALVAALQAFMPELDERERFIEYQDSPHTDGQRAVLRRISAARAAIAKATA